MAHTGMTQAEADAVNEKIATLEATIKAKNTVIATLHGLGMTAASSKGGFATAAIEQLMRELVKPGEELTQIHKDAIKDALDLTDRQFVVAINKFKKEHPEYKEGTPQYIQGSRKRVKLDNKTALRKGLEENSLKMRGGDAKKLGSLLKNTVEVLNIGMHQSDARLRPSDTNKFVTGSMMAMASPNAKIRKRGFNGKAKRRPKGDTP